MKFLIVAPNYENGSAGIRVMHRLCHLINECGGYARLFCQVTNLDWNTPLATDADQFDVVVYPEVVEGNPFQAECAVRYVLNKPGKIGGLIEYGDNEMVWYYTEDLKEPAQKAANGREVYKMTLPIVEPWLFFHGGEKTKTAYYIGKGKVATPPPTDAVEITRGWPPTRAGMADLLRQTKTLYSYDNYSMILMEGHMCGCEVFTVNDKGEWVEYAPPYNVERDEISLVADFLNRVEHYYREAA